MGKKNLTKSSPQKHALEQFFLEHRSQHWDRPTIQAFAQQIGLSRQKVYKWLWDKRKIGQGNRQGRESEQNTPCFGQRQLLQEAANMVTVGPTEMFRYQIRVPDYLQGVKAIELEECVSDGVIGMLKRSAWQLVRPRGVKNLIQRRVRHLRQVMRDGMERGMAKEKRRRKEIEQFQVVSEESAKIYDSRE